MRSFPALPCSLLVLLAALAPAEGKGGTLARAGHLVLDKQVVDYGVVDQDREYTAEVGYANGGTRPIRRLRVQSGCGCYSIALSHTELAPGARGTLTARFRTHGFRGRDVSKPVLLLYDDGAPREAVLRLKLDIVGGVLAERLHLGEVLAGTRPRGHVDVFWYEGVGKPFRITRVDVPGQAVETSVEPHQAGPGSPFKGWRIHFRFTRPLPRGVYSHKAIVFLENADRKGVLIPITANVVGKVWVQTSRVYLGLVERGRTKSASVNFRPFDETVRLGKVSARARRGVLQVAIEDGFGPGGPVKKLRVTVPADAPTGALDDVIELRTEVPGEELVEIDVRGRVFAPRGR